MPIGLLKRFLFAVIPKYEQWRKMKVKDVDQSSVEDFLGVAMDILSKSRQIQEALSSEQQQIYFSVMPKKIKVVSNVFFLRCYNAYAKSIDSYPF